MEATAEAAAEAKLTKIIIGMPTRQQQTMITETMQQVLDFFSWMTTGAGAGAGGGGGAEK